MRIASLVAAFVVAIGLSIAGSPSQAAQLSPLHQLQTNQSLAQPVGYYQRHRGWRNRCVRWRHNCANRWGWGSWRFRRCVRHHGC
jgi:hypothetical protein